MPNDPLPGFNVRMEPLPYESLLEQRPLSQIDLVVMHCTELPDLAMARAYGERVLYKATQTGNSGHFYIDRDGSVHRYVSPHRIAHHTRGYNPRAIGIELVSTGRYPDWLDSRNQSMDETYSDAQIASLIALLRGLQIEIPSLRFIAGHEDLDRDSVEACDDPSLRVRRKLDPGPLFPWSEVLDAISLTRL